jgi:predicted metal-dependent RNase
VIRARNVAGSRAVMRVEILSLIDLLRVFYNYIMTIKIIPLGAGQDVGRSCVIVEVGGRRVMFDCGLHMVSE